jgi:hypothetical protein
MALSIFIGTVLRLYLLPDQILVDDEWHGMQFVIGKSFPEVASGHSIGANSIPMNIWRWLLLNTVGWSELWLRLPSVAAGLLGLGVFPLMIRRLFGSRTAVIFALLLAIAPVPIFYSRMVRPYSMVMLLGFGGLLALLYWVGSGRGRWAAASVLCGVLAACFHLYALLAVFGGLSCLLLFKMARWDPVSLSGVSAPLPPVAHLLATSAGVLFLTTVLVLPSHLKHLWWMKFLGEDRVTLETLVQFTSLLSGTGNPILAVLFVALAAVGMGRQIREAPLVAAIFGSCIGLYLCAVAVSRQQGSHAAIQLTRYSITAFPMVLVLVASGLETVLAGIERRAVGRSRHPGRQAVFFVAVTILIGAFLWAGPLRETYRKPNNFTNHSAFQDSYRPHDWSRSRERALVPGLIMDGSDIPVFYRTLAKENSRSAVVEYPVLIGDNFNQYYYYQHVHRRPILAGYISRLSMQPLRHTDFVYGIWPVDVVMSRVPGTDRIHMKNMIDMMDLSALKRSGAGYIVLHRGLLQEMYPHGFRSEQEFQPAAFLKRSYRRHFGPPVVENERIIVFRIASPALAPPRGS